jgi:hypothetical protein
MTKAACSSETMVSISDTTFVTTQLITIYFNSFTALNTFLSVYHKLPFR